MFQHYSLSIHISAVGVLFFMPSKKSWHFIIRTRISHEIAINKNYDSLCRLPAAFARTVRSFRSAVLPSRKEITEVFGGLPRNQALFIVARSQVQLKHTFVQRKLMGLYLVTRLINALSALCLCVWPFHFKSVWNFLCLLLWQRLDCFQAWHNGSVLISF